MSETFKQTRQRVPCFRTTQNKPLAAFDQPDGTRETRQDFPIVRHTSLLSRVLIPLKEGISKSYYQLLTERIKVAIDKEEEQQQQQKTCEWSHIFNPDDNKCVIDNLY